MLASCGSLTCEVTADAAFCNPDAPSALGDCALVGGILNVGNNCVGSKFSKNVCLLGIFSVTNDISGNDFIDDDDGDVSFVLFSFSLLPTSPFPLPSPIPPLPPFLSSSLAFFMGTLYCCINCSICGVLELLIRGETDGTLEYVCGGIGARECSCGTVFGDKDGPAAAIPDDDIAEAEEGIGAATGGTGRGCGFW